MKKNKQMTSRERFTAALNHKEADKIPLDLCGHQTGIHYSAYCRVLDALEIQDKNILLYDYGQQLPVPCDELLERFGVDTLTVHVPSLIQPASTDLDKEQVNGYVGYWDKFGVFYGRDPNKPRRIYNDIIHPFETFTRPQEIREFDWPSINSSLFDGLKDHAQKLYKYTSKALIGRSVGSIFQWAHYLFGLERFMKMIIKQPAMIIAAFDGLLEYCKAFAKGYLGAAGNFIQTVQFTSDLTGQNGPLISPRLYRKLVKPYQAKLVNYIKELARVKVNFHTCGAAYHFIPDLVEIGVDCINPVQISAAGMDPCRLTRDFGESITFWGGLCNPQSTLPFGTLDKIRSEVLYNMNCFKNGKKGKTGGFIAAPVHNICYDVPAENIIALFDAFKDGR